MWRRYTKILTFDTTSLSSCNFGGFYLELQVLNLDVSRIQLTFFFCSLFAVFFFLLLKVWWFWVFRLYMMSCICLFVPCSVCLNYTGLMLIYHWLRKKKLQNQCLDHQHCRYEGMKIIVTFIMYVICRCFVVLYH